MNGSASMTQMLTESPVILALGPKLLRAKHWRHTCSSADNTHQAAVMARRSVAILLLVALAGFAICEAARPLTEATSEGKQM